MTPDSIISRRRFSLALLSIPVLGLTGCDAADDPDEIPLDPDADTDSGIADVDDENYVQARTFAFDTLVTLSAYGDQAVLDRAVEACARYDSLFSRTVEGSDIWRVNTAGGEPVEVTPETVDLISKALDYCERSGGVFDITIGAVSSLWDFVQGIKPSDEEIQQAIEHIDYRQVHVDGNTVWLDDPEAKLDLGGIAKGWIADALADLYRANGVESGIINLGGNVMALGEKPSGKPWRIGIQDPNSAQGGYIATVDVRDRSVVTSGLYERHFTLDGVDYHHILDPKTGYPVQTDLVSDTLVSERSIDGDGFSTTLFIFGSEEGMKMVDSTEGLEAFFVDSSGEILLSAGFGDYPYEIVGSGELNAGS